MRDVAGSAAAPAARYRKFRRGSFISNLPSHSFNHLVGAGELSLPPCPARDEFGPAVVRGRTAKSAGSRGSFLHAHCVGWQTAIVRKEIALTSARAPRHLSGLADAKVEQHCHRYGHYDEH